jgi:hypothetical protein
VARCAGRIGAMTGLANRASTTKAAPAAHEGNRCGFSVDVRKRCAGQSCDAAALLNRRDRPCPSQPAADPSYP